MAELIFNHKPNKRSSCRTLAAKLFYQKSATERTREKNVKCKAKREVVSINMWRGDGRGECHEKKDNRRQN